MHALYKEMVKYVRYLKEAFNLLFSRSFRRLWKGGRKGTDRSRWLNSPNVYQKVEILETGTPDPKKITKVEVITFENKNE